MDALTLFGLLAVTAMLVFYALEDRSPLLILAFAAACGLASLYGLALRRRRGAIWAGVAVWRWRERTQV
jgi:hypothetical protein